ncbi:MAG: HEAT repeat domain-containing protein [Myxococcales bacterium]|nr:HEAT repeat domain-containing protein [Myxococcales bacterium]
MTLTEIAQALGSEDPEERRVAAGRLVDAGAGTVHLILRALRDPDWRVREEARQVARFRAPDPELLAALIEAMSAPEEMGVESVGLRNAAVDALGAFGEAAVGALAQRIPDLDADGRKLAVEALAATAHPSALAVLRSMLDDEDANVRAAALEAVANLGSVSVDEAVGVLEACLDDPDQFVRLIALNGLNQLGASLPWSRIEPCFRHTVLRRAALEAAGRSGAPQAAEVLAEQLSAQRGSGPEFVATLRATASLAQRGGEGRAALAAKLAHLPALARKRLLDLAASDGEELVNRRCAVSLLGLLGGEDAARVAVAALGDDRVLEEAEVAVCDLGEAATAVLARAVQASEGSERAAAVELLGRVAADLDERARAEAVRVIRGSLQDESLEVVRAALDVLGDMGDASCLHAVGALLSEGTDPLVHRPGEGALAALAQRWPREALAVIEAPGTDPYPALVMVSALGQLARVTEDAPLSVERCVPRLCGGLSHARAAIRRVALEGLAALGDHTCAEEVVFALTDEEPEVRTAAVQALGRLRAPDGTAVGLEQLLAILDSGRDTELMAMAAEALGDLGPPDMLQGLAPLARGSDPRVAVAAVEAIARLPMPRRLEVLRPVLDHRDAEVVKATLRALGDERDPRVLVQVGRCLDHESWDVRRQAADMLGRLGGEAEVQLLRARLEAEQEPLVREALQRALEELGALKRTPTHPQPGSHRIR